MTGAGTASPAGPGHCVTWRREGVTEARVRATRRPPGDRSSSTPTVARYESGRAARRAGRTHIAAPRYLGTGPGTSARGPSYCTPRPRRCCPTAPLADDVGDLPAGWPRRARLASGAISVEELPPLRRTSEVSTRLSVPDLAHRRVAAHRRRPRRARPVPALRGGVAGCFRRAAAPPGDRWPFTAISRAPTCSSTPTATSCCSTGSWPRSATPARTSATSRRWRRPLHPDLTEAEEFCARYRG